ncbi:MAG: hypothetical protein QHH07_02120 [Sedimentisphaerales bacterium]|jgi:hypothetical protein|nr:hypothetical protein [Sedimentisphaerales bacterium]
MGKILAVATNTVRQVVRMRIAVVFFVLLLVILPVLAAASTGDGTVKGRLQTFVSYGLSLIGLLVSLLTIIAMTYTTTADIVQCQVHTVLTKPIRRYQFILGKFLGVMIVDVVVLAIMSGLVFGITIYSPRLFRIDPEQMEQLNNEFFTARNALRPTEPDVSKEVEELYQRLVTSQELEQVFKGLPREQVIARLTQQKRLEKRAASVGQELMWEFHNVRLADPNGSLFIRFKYNVSSNPIDLQISSQWLVGDLRQLNQGVQVGTPIYRVERKDPVRTFREFAVPADAVAKDGYLAVAFLNDLDNDTVVIFPLDEGLEVLYKAGGFTANLLRGVLLILVRLVFLAAVGVFAGSFLSFPVAILLCLLVLFTGSTSGFILESFSFLGKNLSVIYDYTLKLLVQALPRFDLMNPTKFLVSARLIPWSLVLWQGGGPILAKALVLLATGLWVFRSSELARTTV